MKQLKEPHSKNRKTKGLIACGALAAIAGLIIVSLFFRDSGQEPPEPAPALVSADPTEPAATSGQPTRRAQTEEAAELPAPDDAVPAPPPPETAARSSDTPTGIHAFPPLGTRPKLTGIVVPDDFELPPGYVRHYQTTDDGQRLAPILMFDPINPPLDPFGEPIDVPADRIVPPELAPDDMPIDMLELPEQPEPDPRSLRGLLRG